MSTQQLPLVFAARLSVTGGKSNRNSANSQLDTVIKKSAFILPSLFVSFSPNMVSLARSSDAWMYPFFCLSVILKASRISVFGSSCCICLCNIVRKMEKSSSPVFSKHECSTKTSFFSVFSICHFINVVIFHFFNL